MLNVELERVGAEEAGPKAKSQLDLQGPVLNFAQLAQGMGVPRCAPTRAEGFARRWNTRWRTLAPTSSGRGARVAVRRQAQGAALAAALDAQPVPSRWRGRSKKIAP